MFGTKIALQLNKWVSEWRRIESRRLYEEVVETEGDEFYQKILLEFHEKGTDFLLPLQLPSFWCRRPFSASICCLFPVRCSWLRIGVSWMLQRAFMLLCVAISLCRLLFIFNINCNRTNHLTKLRLKGGGEDFVYVLRGEESEMEVLSSFSLASVIL